MPGLDGSLSSTSHSFILHTSRVLADLSTLCNSCFNLVYLSLSFTRNNSISSLVLHHGSRCHSHGKLLLSSPPQAYPAISCPHAHDAPASVTQLLTMDIFCRVPSRPNSRSSSNSPSHACVWFSNEMSSLERPRDAPWPSS